MKVYNKELKYISEVKDITGPLLRMHLRDIKGGDSAKLGLFFWMRLKQALKSDNEFMVKVIEEGLKMGHKLF